MTSRPVLVAVSRDGSPAAIRLAVATAVRDHTALHLVHVVEMTTGVGVRRTYVADQAAAHGAGVLEVAIDYARALLPESAHVTTQISTELAHGDIVGRIVAAGRLASLTVLQRGSVPGSHGLDEQVCARVAAHADGPVVCVPWSWNGSPPRGTVTVGYDEARVAADSLLALAVDTATRSGARLRVLRAVPDDLSEEDLEIARKEIRLALDGLPDPPVTSTVEVVAGRPGELLGRAADLSDLLVVGRHAPHRTGGSCLGSVARAMLTQAACPVLLAPVPDA